MAETIANTTRILAIDPGPECTAYALFTDGGKFSSAWLPNRDLRTQLMTGEIKAPLVLLESPQAQDRPLGPLLRNTIWWAARYFECLQGQLGLDIREVEEPDVRLWLCGKPGGSNSDLYAALRQRFGETQQVLCAVCGGTGKVSGLRGLKNCQPCQARGHKTVRGPLSQITEHERSALAICVWWWEREHRERLRVA